MPDETALEPTDERPVYHVAFPMGTEGPYTLGELRGMLSAGRVQPGDRVLHQATNATCTAADLIPDAVELSAKAERVRRRSTSGQYRTQKSPGSGSEVRRFRTPLPLPVAPAPAPAEEQVTTTATRRKRAMLPVLMVILVVSGALLAALLIADPSSLGPRLVQPPVGEWKADKLGKAGGPWILTLDETRLTVVGPDSHIVHADIERTVVDDTHVTLKLTPPHPVLGAALNFYGAREIEVTGSFGTGIGKPLP